MLENWKLYLKLIFLGITPDPDSEKLRVVKEEVWPKLKEENKLALINKLEGKAIRKRDSMEKNAARGSYKFTGIAFIIAGGVALLVAPEVSSASRILFQICIGILLLGSGFLLVIISAKAKVMAKQDLTPEGIKMAHTALEAQMLYEQRPEMAHWFEYEEAMGDLYKCNLHTIGERRAAWTIAAVGFIATIAMIVAVCLY